MEMHDYTLHAEALGRDMDLVVYGSEGQLAIAFPEGDSLCTSWENAGMIDVLVPLLEAGKLRLVCVDSMDGSTWHGHNLEDAYRLQNLQKYFEFIAHELRDFTHKLAGAEVKPLLIGAGTGATNAAVAFAREPEAYAGLLALGGTYDVRYAEVNEVSDAWLGYSVTDLIGNAADKSALLEALRGKPVAFVTGRAQSEGAQASAAVLQAQLAELGVEATFEFWGADVDGDWYWYKEQLRQLLPGLLTPAGLIERKLVAQVESAAAECDHVTVRLERSQVELEGARSALKEAQAALEAARARMAQEESEVAKYAAEEERLGEAASIAWAEHHRIEAQLDEATIVAERAQAEVDAAAERRATAEWIRGEAAAALVGAQQAFDQASLAVDEAAQNVDAVSDVASAAQAHLVEAQKKRELEHERILELQQAQAGTAAAVKAPATKKAATKAKAVAKATKATKASSTTKATKAVSSAKATKSAKTSKSAKPTTKARKPKK